MKRIEFITIQSKVNGNGLGKGVKYIFENYRDIIKEKLEQGYEYKGFLPVEIRGTGEIEKIDLIFESVER